MNSAFHHTLLNRLAKLNAHGLEDLNKAALMNRVDTKFVLTLDQALEVFSRLQDHYTVLEINNQRLFRYQSTYFDTDDFSLYHLHHNKRLNRHKVRLRHYVDDNSQFLEVKFKNNKKRTIKSRMPLLEPTVTNLQPHHEFLRSTGIDNAAALKPSLLSQYQRLALASEARGERLTMDFNLVKHNLCDPGQTRIGLDNIVIAELKQSRMNRHSPFFAIARALNLRATGFSKYCMGLALTQNNDSTLKANHFKPVARRVSTSPLEEAF